MTAHDATAAPRRSTLPGGVRLVSEQMPGVRSAAVGFFVPVGSRDETPSLAGASHFLEHLLFKGTSARTALEISAAIDAVGGDLNAYTTKEYTCYHARVRDTDATLAIEVLADMLNDSVLATAEIDAERRVVCEEIAMYDDDPSSVADQAFSAQVFRSSALAKPIIGTPKSILDMSSAGIRRYYRTRYAPNQVLVAVAGAVDHDELAESLRRVYAPHVVREPGQPRPRARSGPLPGSGRTPRPRASMSITRRPTEQAAVVLGFPGVSRTDSRRWALSVLSAAVGGGMSSRLFQEIREKRGLAYSVHSYRASYSDAGAFAAYAGCSPSKAEEVLEVMRAVLGDVAANGLADDELLRAKGHVSGAAALDAEDSGSRMNRLGESTLMTGRPVSTDEALGKIAAVTAKQVRAVAAEVLCGPEQVSVAGPFDPDRGLRPTRTAR